MLRSRIYYAIVLLAAIAFRLYFDHGLAAFLLPLVVCLPLLALLLSLPAMLGAQLRLYAYRQSITRGEGARWLIEVSNRRRLPLSRIRVELELRNCMSGALQMQRRRLSGGSQGVKEMFPVDTAHCGRMECRALSFRVYDCLGLFSLARPLPETAVMLCAPIAYAPETLPEADGNSRGGDHLHPRPGGGPAEDYEVRPYRPGDPVRMIHWKLSSKKDEIVIRESLEETRAVPVITFAHFGSPAELDETLDRLAGLSRALLHAQRPHWVLWARAKDGAPRRYYISGEREWYACLSAVLSELAPAAGETISDAAVRACAERVLRIHIEPEGEAGS